MTFQNNPNTRVILGRSDRGGNYAPPQKKARKEWKMNIAPEGKNEILSLADQMSDGTRVLSSRLLGNFIHRFIPGIETLVRLEFLEGMDYLDGYFCHLAPADECVIPSDITGGFPEKIHYLPPK
jgi:hypothetical protein